MSDIKDLKCACWKCYDPVDGCRAWSCVSDFEISIEKTKEAADNYGLGVYEVLALIDLERMGEEENAMNEVRTCDNCNKVHCVVDPLGSGGCHWERKK